jgi:crossover junction endodeoxyribonuclease RuvC
MSCLRIMGLDPGSRVTGFGLLELNQEEVVYRQHGVISLHDEPNHQRRLAGLSESLCELFLKYDPHWVVVEKIFISRNPQSAFILGQVRGVILAQVGLHYLSLAEYPPRVIKKAVTGSGASEKQDVALVLRRILKLPPFEYLDSSDALALAWHQSQVLLANRRQSQASYPL